MPISGQPPGIHLAKKERSEFEAGFQRSRKKNLWRKWDGKTLTIFRGREGSFRWCIGDDEGTRFSAKGYEAEDEALGALWDEVEGWAWL